MQNINIRNNRAKVILLRTFEVSKIETVFCDPKEIRVYVSQTITSSNDERFIELLQELVKSIEFYSIENVANSRDMPIEIVNPFIHVCHQIDRKINKERIIYNGMLLFQSNDLRQQPNDLRQQPNDLRQQPNDLRQPTLLSIFSQITNLLSRTNTPRPPIYRLPPPNLPPLNLSSNLHQRQHNQSEQHINDSRQHLNNIQHPDSPMPRFVENRQGANREIILTDEPSINEVKENVATHLAAIQQTTSQRTSVPLETIVRIAGKINELIISGKSKHPNFTNKSKSGYQKIKNYVHTLTRVWLSRVEIDSFVEEIIKLNPSLTGESYLGVELN